MKIFKIKIENKDELVKRIYEITSLKHDLVVHGGSSYNTPYNYGEDPAFTNLLNKILSVVENNYKVEDVWFNIYKTGGYVKEHNHLSEKYSNQKTGVYYLKKPVNSGELYIENEKIELSEDDFIIFGGEKNHYTSKNKTNEDRIVVSFNFVNLYK